VAAPPWRPHVAEATARHAQAAAHLTTSRALCYGAALLSAAARMPALS
jgi:hypothetical protein